MKAIITLSVISEAMALLRLALPEYYILITGIKIAVDMPKEILLVNPFAVSLLYIATLSIGGSMKTIFDYVINAILSTFAIEV